MHYREALSPEDADRMEEFLRALSWALQVALDYGRTVRIWNFVEAWRKEQLGSAFDEMRGKAG
ncbi:MAG: hypothetical protein ACPLRM_02900 [Anaerolineae bacterium]